MFDIYRRQLNDQQNNMISQQRAQLRMGQEEMGKIDHRIMELQERLSKKRTMNQQLASQINAATTAKQAQLRAIQQGMMNKNKNKPVSTVEPFQRHEQIQQQSEEQHNKINKNLGPVDDLSAQASANPVPGDPKYQTLPFSTKFGAATATNTGAMSKTMKIEQLKQEKENNNVQFSQDLPPPPPTTAAPPMMQRPASSGYPGLDHQGNYNNGEKPVSSVAPVYPSVPRERPKELFPSTPPSQDPAALTSKSNNSFSLSQPQNSSTPIANKESPDSPTKSKPALPPKPANGTPTVQQPPPYVPAPPPESSSRDEDASITIRGNQGYHPAGNLSVSTHPEEGTSVDDDMPSPNTSGSEEDNKGSMSAYNHNVHISINRRIQMPPAFHFPEDQTPPSDLIGSDFSKDMADNASMYPMMNQIYKEFDHLSTEEKSQLMAKTGVMEEEEAAEEYAVPEFESADTGPRPKGIIRLKNLKGQLGSEAEAHDRHVCFDPLALLLDASLEGELDLVMKTAREVTDPSAANDEGITALHNAICAGHYDIVRFLVEFGCDVNAQDSDGWTPLHCAASCNNLSMVRFLVEHGACIFAATFSDQETAAEKCEEDEEGFAGCSEYLYSVQEKLGLANGGKVYAVYDYDKNSNGDELTFEIGQEMTVLRKGDDVEKDWWWSNKKEEETVKEGYIPRNFLGMFPRVMPGTERSSSGDGEEIPQEMAQISEEASAAGDRRSTSSA